MSEEPEFSHLDAKGNASMVNVGGKPAVRRIAEAEGRIVLRPETVRAIRGGDVPKGDVLSVARIAGIQAAKRTDEWIPLCHTLPLDAVSVQFEFGAGHITITARAECSARTGVEMEALTAVSAAALTIYDMCKAVDKNMIIQDIRLLRKSKEDAPGVGHQVDS